MHLKNYRNAINLFPFYSALMSDQDGCISTQKCAN